MFKTKPTDSFPLKVTLHVPGRKDQTVEFEALHLDEDAYDEAVKTSENDNQACQKVICGWNRTAHDRFDADYTPELFAATLRSYPGLGTQIFKAYIAELTGRPQVKNF